MKYNDLTLGTIEAIVNKLGGMEGVGRFLRGGLVVKAAELLREVARAAVGGAARFVARDHLTAANIGWMSDDFKRYFLNVVEEKVEGVTLTVHRLKKASLGAPILSELGDCAEISLAHFFELMKRQSKGEAGPLLVNGWANIAYIRGNDGNLWAVDAYWNDTDRDWDVYVYSVEDPHEWGDGRQVLSR